MVTVTDPSWVTAGAGAVSQGRNRSGTSSPGTEGHSQQMNLALLSSGHGVGGCSGGSSAVLSAARVAAEGGPSPSNWDQSMWLIGPGPPPCRTQCQVRATRPASPNSSRSSSTRNSITVRGGVIAGGSGSGMSIADIGGRLLPDRKSSVEGKWVEFGG